MCRSLCARFRHAHPVVVLWKRSPGREAKRRVHRLRVQLDAAGRSRSRGPVRLGKGQPRERAAVRSQRADTLDSRACKNSQAPSRLSPRDRQPGREERGEQKSEGTKGSRIRVLTRAHLLPVSLHTQGCTGCFASVVRSHALRSSRARRREKMRRDARSSGGATVRAEVGVVAGVVGQRVLHGCRRVYGKKGAQKPPGEAAK